MNLFAMVGSKTGELLSYREQVLVHFDPDELRYLFPGQRVVRLASTPEKWLHISDHPNLKGVVTFPLEKSDFFN